MPMRVAPACAALALVAAVAIASGIPKQRANVASATARWCAPAKGVPVSLQCDFPVWVATGRRLTDAGTARTTDAGAPMVPGSADVLVTFPGDPYRIDLGPSEQCFAALSQSTGDGGNWCVFLERNAP